jgi:excinuclease ABC subunit A
LDVFASAARAGFTWAIADNKRVSCDDPPRLAKTKEHDISIVVRDAAALREIGIDEFREAIRWGRGTVHIDSGGQISVLSTGGVCHECGFSIGEIDPRYFSFNTVQGQCGRCEGTGVVSPKKTRGRRATMAEKRTCPDCGGARLSPFARRAILKGHSYPSLTSLSVGELQKELRGWTFQGRDLAISSPIMKELNRRVAFLSEVGLDYLSLDRAASTLSGGEIQRLRLAAQLGADLTGALYVLDEPTIGLHPRDTSRLLANLRRLVDTGSTVLMVEHDQDAIAAADHLIDLGPRGGTHGGNVVAAGTPTSVLKNPASPTGRAFKAPPVSRKPKELPKKHPRLKLTGASQNNLKGGELLIPHSALTVVVGVSGSGKSSLIREVLLPALKKKLSLVGPPPGAFENLSGSEEIKRAVAVDQSPIGRTPRSVPATFLGIFDLIRKLFEKTSDARMRGFTAARFSFNTPKGGRCPTCEGQGVLSHEMSFLPDAITPCPACDSMRFEARTLEVRFMGKSIGEVLALSCEEAIEVFSSHPKICAPLKVLCDLGAGYITLGQGSHTLSGGEAQRLKLAAELCAGSRHEHTLYVLDEPTTGLHLSDVGRLVEVLSRLVDRGDTCVVIEHQPDLIASADWVVELGPEGGPEGGHIVFQGSVKDLRRTKTATASVLKKMS